MKFDATTMMGVALGKRRELTGRQALVDAMIGQAVGGNQALALVLTDRLNRRHASTEPRPPADDPTVPATGSEAEPDPKPKPIGVEGSIEGISEEIMEAMEVLFDKHGTSFQEFLRGLVCEVMQAREEEFERLRQMLDRRRGVEAVDPSSGMHQSEIELRQTKDLEQG